ncbi:MAG TPA: preprotein translocase subunit SecG [Candidatus Limnocylindrales bacterium]|jgi:preprotein translocase subunit SecG|nr:preprotein translocase subunit SecG [Candidatus Limnocylindrales bacterium]
MALVIGLLTLVMVLDCVLLVLLVLIQLPKKEAGAGVAFGGAATDALFGAGKGNVLTQITKYAATGFFVLAVILSIMQSRFHSRTTSKFQQLIGQPGRQAPVTAPASSSATPPAKPAVPLTSSTNALMSPQVEDTNAAAATVPTNPAAPK